jgi:hypothetical protein
LSGLVVDRFDLRDLQAHQSQSAADKRGPATRLDFTRLRGVETPMPTAEELPDSVSLTASFEDQPLRSRSAAWRPTEHTSTVLGAGQFLEGVSKAEGETSWLHDMVCALRQAGIFGPFDNGNGIVYGSVVSIEDKISKIIELADICGIPESGRRNFVQSVLTLSLQFGGFGSSLTTSPDTPLHNQATNFSKCEVETCGGIKIIFDSCTVALNDTTPKVGTSSDEARTQTGRATDVPKFGAWFKDRKHRKIKERSIVDYLTEYKRQLEELGVKDLTDLRERDGTAVDAIDRFGRTNLPGELLIPTRNKPSEPATASTSSVQPQRQAKYDEATAFFDAMRTRERLVVS